MTNTDTLAAALREILPFVAHHSTCPYSESSSSPDSDFCTCRVESLLRAADKALRGLQEPVPPPPKCSECHGSGRTDNHVTGEVECGTCGGAGFYPSGPTDAPIQTQCEYCDGTGWVGGEPVPPPGPYEVRRVGVGLREEGAR